MPEPNRARLGEQRPPQRHKIFNSLNIFDYDESKRPPGMTYGYKRCKIAGMEDEDNLILCEQNGWTPVPASRHPECAGMRRAKEEPNSPIIKRGLMLMEIPTEWHDQSVEMDDFRAKNTLEEQVQRYGLQARREGAPGISRGRQSIDLPISRRRTESGGEIVE